MATPSRPYDYANRLGVLKLSWMDVSGLCKELSAQVSMAGADAVVGIARAGLIPATQVALHLRCELFPVRLTRRERGEVLHRSPVWKAPPPADVAGKAVAVIDEMSDTGETLAIAAAACLEAGAARVITAALVAHSWADPAPGMVALRSDAFVLFPWDREVYSEGHWRPHPEVEAGLRAQEQQQQ